MVMVVFEMCLVSRAPKMESRSEVDRSEGAE